MVHFPVHFVNELKFGGPVCDWWMRMTKRYLGKLKSYVKNRNRPEASTAEGYLAGECLVFYSRYLNDAEKIRSKRSNQCHMTDDKTKDEGSSLFPITGYPLGKKKKGKKGNAFSLDSKTRTLAHRYNNSIVKINMFNIISSDYFFCSYSAYN
ncbi:unnamed protein product [Amaranthus hypochondriacus]